MKATYDVQAEEDVLARLRDEFGPQGYTLIAQPGAEHLPDFVGNYRPDALLVGPGRNIIVEIKTFPSSSDENLRAEFLAREIPKHENWSFLLVLAKPPSYGTVDAPRINRAISEFRNPHSELSRKQNFVMAWAVFEAAARFAEERLDPDRTRRNLPTFAVLEKLASLGELDDAKVAELIDLATIRNRLVHGGLDVDVPPEATDKLLAEAQQLVEAA
jgi:REase_AHJR-like